MSLRQLLAAVSPLCLALGTFAASLPAAEPQDLEFFEQKIRPVLVQHCYSCHSADAAEKGKLRGELALDTRAAVTKGGETGPSVVPGKPDESLLLKALQYDGLEMPPTGKLPEAVIADFRRWIELGAPDPRDGAPSAGKKREINLAEGKQFWSFQPLVDVAVPEVTQSAWVKTPIDRFILAKLEQQKLAPSQPASREKLLRRLTYDLVGLPPTPEQAAAFLNDTSATAVDTLIDTLLQSQHYGERWGRHWLDAVRFAESGGYEFDGFRPGAYHYRDWVIRALNQDLPFDQFVKMQLAGDVLQPGYQGASATGFLMAGPFPGQITAKTEERIRYDQLDDIMMTVGGSMLGLTLGCVRCHEHKYDPFPHTDYYGMVASFARATHGSQFLDPDPAATQRAIEQHAADLVKLQQERTAYAHTTLPARFQEWQQKLFPQLTGEPRWQVGVPQSVETTDTWLATEADGVIRFTGPNRRNADTYTVTVFTHQKNLTALRLDALTDKSLPNKGPGLGGDGSFTLGDFKVTAKPLDPASTEAPVVLKLKPAHVAFEEQPHPFKNAVDDNPGTFWRAIGDNGKDNAGIFEIEGGLPGFASGTRLQIELKFASDGLGRFRLSFSTAPGAPTWAGEVQGQHLGELRTILAANNNTLPESLREQAVTWLAPFDPPTAEVVRKIEQHVRAKPRAPLTEVYTAVAGGRDVFFLRRGEVDAKAGQASPAFLQVLMRNADGPAKWLPTPAAGQPATEPRLALGNWMTDVDDGAGALLARVIVNRLWQHHFGRGLVGTPNDFGAQGERPTHPELLDWLARELIRNGWKLKPLHKLIVQSAVYQQGNDAPEANLQADPQNRLLWHYRPRRLEAEVIRDAILAIGGNLDTTMYGPSFLDNVPRRSVYLRVKRSELIPFLTMFDAPEPTQSIGERISTTVPTQALALMNSPFVRQQAQRLAQRVRPNAEVPLTAAIEQAYRITVGRLPTAAERDRMQAFIETSGGNDPGRTSAALVEFCQVLLCLNEFVYID